MSAPLFITQELHKIGIAARVTYGSSKHGFSTAYIVVHLSGLEPSSKIFDAVKRCVIEIEPDYRVGTVWTRIPYHGMKPQELVVPQPGLFDEAIA
jgi:hypothetical protein